MSNTADFDRWGRPHFDERHPDDHRHRMHSGWHPGWIALTVLGFIIWWPVGLALLFFTLGSRKFGSRNMGCWNSDRFANKMERMQSRMDRMRDRMERRGFGGGFGFGPPSSGNRAFDDYRMETLRRLEDEQTEFKDFLERLRHAKDKAEFDQFMSEHKTRPSSPPQADQPHG